MSTYEMSGTYVEACDCPVICPCWVGEPPDEDECAGFFAWHIDQGTIDGVDVSNLAVASLSFHEGHRADGGLRVVQVIDHAADSRQRHLLDEAFSGRLGGPLGELARLTDEVLEVVYAPIEIASDGHRTSVTVGERADVTMRPLIGSTNRITMLSDSALATAFGTPAEVGRADRFRMTLGHHQIDVDVRDRSALRGRFRYRHAGRR